MGWGSGTNSGAGDLGKFRSPLTGGPSPQAPQEMAGVPGGRTPGQAPLWTVLCGALGLWEADIAFSPPPPPPVTLSCQLVKALGYGQKSSPASQPRTNNGPLQLGTDRRPSPTRDKPRPRGRAGLPWEERQECFEDLV